MTVVLPGAAPGIVSGCLLAVARAAGETAPLIFTIGAARNTNWNLFEGTNTALSTQIYANATHHVRRRPGAGVGRRAHPDRLRSRSCSLARVIVARTLRAATR